MSPPFYPEKFVYILLPGTIQPMARGAQYEERIESELVARSLGCVSGGGSFLSDPGPDGNRVVESCGIDGEVADLAAGLALLHDLLPELGAPDDSKLHYTHQGVRLLDRLSKSGWQPGQARASPHPGFGV